MVYGNNSPSRLRRFGGGVGGSEGYTGLHSIGWNNSVYLLAEVGANCTLNICMQKECSQE